MPNEYTLRALSDLAKIPADRLDVCLEEVKEWVEIMRQHADFEKLMKEAGAETFAIMIWVDDNKPGATALEYQHTIRVVKADPVAGGK